MACRPNMTRNLQPVVSSLVVLMLAVWVAIPSRLCIGHDGNVAVEHGFPGHCDCSRSTEAADSVTSTDCVEAVIPSAGEPLCCDPCTDVDNVISQGRGNDSPEGPPPDLRIGLTFPWSQAPLATSTVALRQTAWARPRAVSLARSPILRC